MKDIKRQVDELEIKQHVGEKHQSALTTNHPFMTALRGCNRIQREHTRVHGASALVIGKSHSCTYCVTYFVQVIFLPRHHCKIFSIDRKLITLQTVYRYTKKRNVRLFVTWLKSDNNWQCRMWMLTIYISWVWRVQNFNHKNSDTLEMNIFMVLIFCPANITTRRMFVLQTTRSHGGSRLSMAVLQRVPREP